MPMLSPGEGELLLLYSFRPLLNQVIGANLTQLHCKIKKCISLITTLDYAWISQIMTVASYACTLIYVKKGVQSI